MASPAKHSLDSVITPAFVKSIAGATYYRRGEEYFNRNTVQSIAEYQGTITATVLGTRQYKVRLRAAGKSLDYSCTCPLGRDDAFCKHCVATALTWLDAKEHGDVAMLDDVEQIITTLKNEDLVRLVVEQALKDEDFRNRVLAVSGQRTGGTALLPHYRKMVEEAMSTCNHYDDYEYGYYDEFEDELDYSEKISDLIESLDDLLTQEHQAPAVMELALYAIERAEQAMNNSSDESGSHEILFADLSDLHLRASSIAKPDPIELATQLFWREMKDEWGAFTDTYSQYGAVLGEKGRNHFQKLAEGQWKLIKPITQKSRPVYDRSRSRVTKIMESIARASGGLKELVDVLRKDLSSARHYLRIAEVCRDAKQDDIALQWAEEGLYQFGLLTDSDLLEFLAEEYSRRKMTEKMMNISWQKFSTHLSVSSYQAMVKRAPNAAQKKLWRAKAVDSLLARAAKSGKKKFRGYSTHNSDAALLIAIHLLEHDDNAAWETAQKFGCDETLWLKLAAERAIKYPEDALTVYRSQVDARLPHAEGYEETVDLLKKIQPLMTRLGRADEFNEWITDLRATWKRRKNFILLLNAKISKR
ncbi:MAG: hypothetical protein ABIQ57_03515 [Candidatus Kapaibacterium sp.]